jgi:general secretion pathway protein D
VDTLLAQVLIEAIIMEVSLQDSLNFGVTAGQRPKQFNGDPKVVGGGVMNNDGNPLGTGNQFLGGIAQSASNFPSGSGLNYFMQLGNNWDVAMNALATDSRVNVVQRPRVLTSHATEGSFQVGSVVPFVSGSFFGGGFGNSTQIQRQFVGVELQVIPFITPDNLVVMEINQTIAQVGAPTKIDGNDIPSTENRSASSTVTVRNKESILLGGYITASTARSSSGVPGLSSVPILGNLFSSKSRNGKRTEMMVLLRPTVLPTPADAATMADAERARLPGVRVAEKEFEKTEEAENNKADKLLRDAERKAKNKKK